MPDTSSPLMIHDRLESCKIQYRIITAITCRVDVLQGARTRVSQHPWATTTILLPCSANCCCWTSCVMCVRTWWQRASMRAMLSRSVLMIINAGTHTPCAPCSPSRFAAAVAGTHPVPILCLCGSRSNCLPSRQLHAQGWLAANTAGPTVSMDGLRVRLSGYSAAHAMGSFFLHLACS